MSKLKDIIEKCVSRKADALNLRKSAARSMSGFCLGMAFLSLGMGTARAQVTMTAADTSGQTSFNTNLHWSDGLAPSSGKTYSTSYTLRTPYSGSPTAEFTFAGDSLTLNSGGVLNLRGTDGVTVSANLVLNGGYVISNGSAYSLDGTIDVQAASSIYGYTKMFTVNSAISGSAELTLQLTGFTSPDATGGVILTNSSNSYTGGTVVGNYASVYANADGVLGTGDVSLLVGSTITLSGGTSNNYIADGASLILRPDSNGVNLDFSGSDTIAGISLDSGSTFLDPGVYGAIGSGAQYEISALNGTGTLTVIPESSSSALVLAILFFTALRLKVGKEG